MAATRRRIRARTHDRHAFHRRLVSRMRELERKRSDSHQASGSALPPLAVIGAGRVGRSITRAASEAGASVSLSGRRDALAAAE
ncbi:MAG: hypothetical protein ACRDL1_08665, partial [Solirubrobacterales bacterium]